jgi:YfiH family protein
MDTTPPCLTHPLLEAKGIHHGFFTRHGGVSTGLYDSLNGGLGSADDATAVNKNRAMAVAVLGGNSDDICGLHQIHSAQVHDAVNGATRPEGDGLVSDKQGLALTILTADCAPVLLLDHHTYMIAACHAGWRGAVAGITEATIDRMEARGAARDSIVAVIGPTIRQESYQVGEDLRDIVLDATPWADECFAEDQEDGRFRFDLPGYLLLRLTKARVESAAIAVDTYSDDRFFSHRRATHEGLTDSGRLISMIRRSA